VTYPTKPPNEVARLDAKWFTSVCELGPRPLVVTGWLKLWMQGHFTDRANIDDFQGPDPTGPLWKPDFKVSKMAIESASKWIPELTEMRPSIIIKRNAWKRMRLGIDDRMMFHLDPDAQNRYANWWRGSHTLFCITGDGAESEKLGAEVFRELNEFGPVVRQILDLKMFQVDEVGALLKVKPDARENYAVPVTVNYVYEEFWKINQEAPIFKKMMSRIDLKDFQP
jgi:hypothetical protein